MRADTAVLAAAAEEGWGREAGMAAAVGLATVMEMEMEMAAWGAGVGVEV